MISTVLKPSILRGNNNPPAQTKKKKKKLYHKLFGATLRELNLSGVIFV